VKLPQELLNSLRAAKGFDEKAFVAVHEETARITSIRWNPFKPAEPEFKTGAKVPWCDNGVYLEERPSFTFDPLFHAGCYYVQEAGSMFLHHALKNSANLKNDLLVLDLCAAPGGKSTLISDLISGNSVLISNEVIKPRAEVLSQNLGKWGTCNNAVTNSDPMAFSKLEAVFDVIVADVPCSGSGLFRKQPDAVNEWSVDNVNLCCTRQKRILGDAMNCLKENGVLIYSTCSYSLEEDEQIVEWLIKEMNMELVSLPIDASWGITDTGLGYRFYPYLTKSEGFFCAVLRKTAHGAEHRQYKTKYSLLEKPKPKELAAVLPYLKDKDNKVVMKFKDEFKLLNPLLLDLFNRLGKDLYFKKLGTAMGELKHSDFLPDHELALSIYLGDKLNRCELSKLQALAFLKKENFEIEAPKGLCLMTYKSFGLGWVKVLDKRINNYLPKDYRILSSEEI